MHAIGSGIMGDSTCDICLKYNFTMYLQCQQTQIRKRYLASIFCITVIQKLSNERLGKFASTCVRLCQTDLNETCTELSLSCKSMS